MDNGICGNVAAIGIEPAISLRIRKDAAGALKDERGGSNIPNPEVQVPVSVQASAGDVAYSERG